jgi:hypothetical protein
MARSCAGAPLRRQLHELLPGEDLAGLAFEPGLALTGAPLTLPGRFALPAPTPPPPSPTGHLQPQPRIHWRQHRQRCQEQQVQELQPLGSHPPGAQHSSSGSSGRPSSASLRTLSAGLPASGGRVQSWLGGGQEPAWLRQHLQADAAQARREQQGVQRPVAPGPAPAWPAAEAEAALRSLPAVPRPRRSAHARRLERGAMSTTLPKVLLD